MSRALFLDRDGVFNELINRGHPFPSAPWNWQEVKFYSGFEVLQIIRERGYLLIMVTNQPDIERGLVDKKFVDELNDYYAKKYSFTQTYYCSSADPNHPDKKPNPGMLLRAADQLGIDLEKSWFLGDTKADIGAAARAGCQSILIDRPYNKDLEPKLRIYQMSELAGYL